MPLVNSCRKRLNLRYVFYLDLRVSNSLINLDKIVFSATFSSGVDSSGLSGDAGNEFNDAVVGRGRANSSALCAEEVPPFQPIDSMDDPEPAVDSMEKFS